MKRVFLFLISGFLFFGCANKQSPEVSQALQLREEISQEESEPKAVKKKYPVAKKIIIQTLAEKEKEILSARVYEVFFGKELINQRIINRYKDLLRCGNEVILEVYAPPVGVVGRAEGRGGSILKNVELAATQIREDKKLSDLLPGMIKKNQIYFLLKLSDLQLMIWGGGFNWTRIIDGHYFLPVQKINFDFFQERIRQNKSFLDHHQNDIRQALVEEYALPKFNLLPWLEFGLAEQEESELVQTIMKFLADKFSADYQRHDDELSYVVDSEGKMDLGKTISYAFFLVKTKGLKKLVSDFRPLLNTLLFLQDNSGSIYLDFSMRERLRPGEPAALLLAQIFFLLKTQDQSFQEEYEKIINYYFPRKTSNYEGPIPNLIRGNLYLAQKDSSQVKANLNWFFQKIQRPGVDHPEEQGAFRWEHIEDHKYDLEVIFFIFKAYSWMKEFSPKELNPTWEVKLFFLLRNFLNFQIETPNILLGTVKLLKKEDIGSFWDSKTDSKFNISSQLCGASTFQEIGNFRTRKNWDEVKEAAEVLT